MICIGRRQVVGSSGGFQKFYSVANAWMATGAPGRQVAAASFHRAHRPGITGQHPHSLYALCSCDTHIFLPYRNPA